MPHPSVQALSEPLRAVSREIAERLARQGVRVWIVGGAVRDLALGRPIQDVDLTSAAPPDLIEREFERTIPIGREFGTVIVHLHGRDVEHTTFRTEDRYADARRPDSVSFGATPEEDATRRDFTCNALYLDPLDDELRDPTGGLRDLENGRLVCVGDPGRRFAEDGLRIVRLARFAGQLDLQPTPETLAAARASLSALRGVSPERLRVEFEHLFERGGVVRAFELLVATGALERLLPVLGRPARVAPARALLAALPPRPGPELGFAAWFDPALEPDDDLARAAETLASLRPSRKLLDHVRAAWRLASEFTDGRPAPRSRRIRWMRQASFDTALGLALARARAIERPADALEALRAERDALGAEGLAARPLLTAADLLARGLQPGPAFALWLGEIETLHLDGEIADRAAALAWLERRVQDGGNERRNA